MSSPTPALNGHRHPSSSGLIAGLIRRLGTLIDDPTIVGAVANLADDIALESGQRSSNAIDRLADAFKLSPFERDLLVLIGLPDEHDSLAMSARRLHPLGEPWLSFATLSEVLCLDHNGRHHLRQALDSGPLRHRRLLVINDSQPFPEASIRLSDGLWSAVRGGGRWPTGLRPVTVSTDPTADISTPAFRRLVAAAKPGSDQSIVLVSGPGRRPGDLASSVATAIAGISDAAASSSISPAVFFAADQLGPEHDPLISAHAVARNCTPVIVGRPTKNPLPDHPGPVVVCLDDQNGLELDDRPMIAIDMGSRTIGEDVAMWRRLVPDIGSQQAAATLAGLLRVDSVRAARAVGDARATAQLDNTEVTSTMVIDHVRRRSMSTLPPSVRLVRPTADWSGLVTTPHNHDLLTSIVNRVENQAQVLLDWQFGQLPGRRGSRGVRALFAGPPGTGKTLSAEILASVLELDLLVVDLSALVSKWLGETEKNISEVFDTADRCQSVLFFDEADSVFARRTDGSDAQGRWANLETAHLLTRMEQYDGLVILATNLRGNIDDAFIRRLDVIVEFDEPGPEERRRLWANHLPAAAPRSADVDTEQLADLYQITGGLIRNAALDAGFRAASVNQRISQLDLVMAVEREFDKAGKTFPGIPRHLRHPDPAVSTADTFNQNRGQTGHQEGA